MKDIASGQLGDLGQYSVVVQDGKLVVQASLDLLAAADKAKSAIPGKFDDVVLELLKGLLKQL